MTEPDPNAKEWRVDWTHRHTGTQGQGVDLMTKEAARLLAHRLESKDRAFHRSVVHVPQTATASTTDTESTTL